MQRTRGTAAAFRPAERATGAQFSAGIAIVGLLYLLAFVNCANRVVVALSLASYVFVYTPLKRPHVDFNHHRRRARRTPHPGRLDRGGGPSVMRSRLRCS